MGKIKAFFDELKERFGKGTNVIQTTKPELQLSIKPKSLKAKCVVVVAAIVIFSTIAIYISFSDITESAIETSLHSSTIAATSPTAESLATSILQEDYQKIKTTSLSLINSTSAKYAFLLDEDADLLYIAEQDSIPSSLLTANKPDKKTTEASQKPLLVDGELVWDYAVPIANGELGWIRIGVPASAITETKRSLLLLAVVVGGVCFVFGLVATSLVVGRFSTKIITLADAVEKLSTGESKEPIPISGDDEIGLLAEALERLRLSIQVLKRHPGGM